MPVLAGDRRTAWDRNVLSDPRVTNLWDGNQLFGTWFQTHGGAFWDAYLLYDPQARWRDKPEGLVSWGSTIIGSTGELTRALEPLLEP